MMTLPRFSRCAALAAWVVGCAAVASAQSGPAPKSVHWRFEKGADGRKMTTALSEDGKCEAVAGGEATVLSMEVPLAVLPLTGDANHLALSFRGGHLRAKSCEALNLTKNFTVELWAKFEAAGPSGTILLCKGDPQKGNWHFIHQSDGTVQANIFGQAPAYLFSPESGGPVPGAWYHLAAVFEEQGAGKTRIRTFVNGHPRGAALVASMTQTSDTDLFIGSFVKGDLPFVGMIDEVRITPAALGPKSFLLAGTQAIAEMSAPRAPVFVAPGTAIDAALRAKADGAPIVLAPKGYQHFYTPCGGPANRLNLGMPPAGYDPAFATAMQAWLGGDYSTGSGYHFAVEPGVRCIVAVGYWDPINKPGHQVQHVVVDGVVVDALDPAADGRGKPLVRLYPACDRNRDGLLEVFVRHVRHEVKAASGQMNLLWVFREVDGPRLDKEKLARGANDVPPLYFVPCGREAKMLGHVGYPALSEATRRNMLPLRPVMFDRKPDWPQPVDPLDVEIRGELADRIRTYLDRWGFAGRDDGDRHPLGFASDAGYEVAGRSIETLYLLGRLMRRDFDLRVPFEGLLKKQDMQSKHPGAFVGGQPRRTAFIWSQSTIFSGLLAYHELSGDARALAAAERLADWYAAYLSSGDLAAANYFLEPKNEFSRTGATVGQLGEGALEPMLWLYWRTRNPKYLESAKKIADLKRRFGGVAWMIHGDIADVHPEYESWHLHANLSTVRGFPWLYAATGDRSYLDDAVAASDRVHQRATWGVGCVLEQIPWLRDPDPHDETCQTADALMLSYLLGDYTGEGRFYDRGETIYYNAIRYMQMHRGNFTAFNRLPGPTRGGDAWFCCGWWGAKALYETARHLYAASPNAVYVTGYMPSCGDLRLEAGSVRIETEADIPRSGRIRITVTPKGVQRFALNLRVPGWAAFKGVRVNGESVEAATEKGYVRLTRGWKAGDRVDVNFDLPLRVVLDSAWDTLGTAKVSVDGAPPVEARCVSIYRGPVILTQFRLLNGVDLNWGYTGDHPDLFDTLNSVADRFAVGEQKFQSNTGPALTRITHTADGVKLQWGWKPGPGWGWSVRRSALVRPTVPLSIDYSAEVTLPGLPPPQLEAVAKAARFCGVRMRTSGFVDYTTAKLSVGGKRLEPGDVPEGPLSGRDATLDNGYVQFRITSAANDLAAVGDEATGYQGIYCCPRVVSDRQIIASCTLTVAGQNQFSMPIIAPGPSPPGKP